MFAVSIRINLLQKCFHSSYSRHLLARGRSYASQRSTMSRTVKQSVPSEWTDEGKGARVRRSIGRSEFRNLDPFLALDEFVVTAPGGFPDHPHRGFETVTYLFDGTMMHEDFLDQKGVLNAGALQWMTAGRGVVHCEMPKGPIAAHGLQLWINLPAKQKMIEPVYQEMPQTQVPHTTKDGVTVKVIAGESMGLKSPIYTRTPTMYLDFTLDPGSKMRQDVPKGWTTFAYILTNNVYFGPDSQLAESFNTIVFDDGDHVEAVNKGTTSCHFMLIAGQPLNEPIARHGPFVMNTDAEIEQAISDYHSCTNGFEKARGWKSSAKK